MSDNHAAALPPAGDAATERWTSLAQALTAYTYQPALMVRNDEPGVERDAPRTPACPRCGDLGYYQEQAALLPTHPHFGKLFPCACQAAARAQRDAAQLQRLSNLDAFVAQTFATFDVGVDGVEQAVLAALAYAEQPTGWLVLLGGYGCGKTHLAAAIAQTALGRGEGVLFLTVPDLLDHLRATFAPGSAVSYDAQFERVCSVGLLVLDDIGTEQATPWAREKLYQIIDHRYTRRLPTVITSNTPLETLDGRIRSRMVQLAGQAGIVHINAADYRERSLAAPA